MQPGGQEDEEWLRTERTPLLHAESEDRHAKQVAEHEAMYKRFSPAKKRVIVFLVSCSGLVPLFVSGSFIPSIPQIAHDLNTTGSIVNIAVSVSFFTGAFGMLVWASYSTFYGRRPIYLAGLPILIIGSLGVGLARTVPELLIWRIIQAFGSSGGISLGAGVIGDIYKLEERGAAMGIFFGAILLGPALAPVTGGTAAHYFSWRMMQFSLAVAGFVAFVTMLFLFPETCHPGTRGVDQFQGRRFVFLNPFKSLELMKSPNMFSVMITGTCVLLTDYVLLVPLAYTLGSKYGITNEALIGACFLPCGLGNLIGAPLAGRISDNTLVKWKKRRNGEWVPEDRLRASLAGAFVLVPGSVVAFGLTTTYVDGTLGLVMNLIWLFCNGMGVDLVLSPSAAYGVDILHHRSAETMAANNSVRNVILSFAIAGILPLINTIGLVWTNVISAVIAWFGALVLLGTIKYGAQMRSWVTMEYTTTFDTT